MKQHIFSQGLVLLQLSLFSLHDIVSRYGLSIQVLNLLLCNQCPHLCIQYLLLSFDP
jgi:hypothetical protein